MKRADVLCHRYRLRLFVTCNQSKINGTCSAGTRPCRCISVHTQGLASFGPVSSMSQAATCPPLTLLISGQPVVVLNDSLLAMLLQRTPYTIRPRQPVEIATLQAGLPVSQLGGCSEDPSLSPGSDWPLVVRTGGGDSRRMSGFSSQALVPSHGGHDVAVVPSNPHTLSEGEPVRLPTSPVQQLSPELQWSSKMSQSSQTSVELGDQYSPTVGESVHGTVQNVQGALPSDGTEDLTLPLTEAKSDYPVCPRPRQTSPSVSVGEKILCTLAEGIVAIGQDGHDTLKEGQLVPNLPAEKPNHSFPSLRAAMAAFICEEREQLGTDSDSEIEDTVIDDSRSPPEPQGDIDDSAADLAHSPNTLSDSLCGTVMAGGTPDRLEEAEVPCMKQWDLSSPSPPPLLSNEIKDIHKDSPQSLKGTSSAVECPSLGYPREVPEDADDGSATVNQALPLEGAREHAMVPRLVSCKEDGRGDGSSDEEGGMGTGDNQHPPPIEKLDKQSPSQPLPACKSEPICQTVDRQRPLQSHFSPVPTQTSQQVVPDALLETSFPPQTLYEEEELSKSVPCVPSLEAIDVDALDGPTVLCMAMAAVGSRKRKLADAEDRSADRPQWEGLHSSAGWRGSLVQPGLVATTHLNLSRPRLRLGLSRHYRRTPLHHIK